MKHTMPVLNILHTESSLGWGGQEIRILSEARGMIDRGHQVTLACPAQAQIAAAAERLGIPCLHLPIARKNLAGLWALRRWLARHGERFDVINTHSSTDSWLVALARLGRRRSPPVVRTRHVSTAVHPGALQTWLYTRACRHVVVTGEALRQQLHTDNGIPLQQMSSVPTGIDLQRFGRHQETSAARRQLHLPERPSLCIVATLRDWKGHDDLLQAFLELQESLPDWQLLVVGDGPRRSHLERRVHEMSLQDRVIFAGNVDDVPLWLASADVFVLPSFGHEGVPQSIMQAMATSLPVISTPVGAIAEVVEDAVTGLLVPARDVPALKAAMARLMSDAALRQRMGTAARQAAEAGMGMDRMLDRMEVIFQAACGVHA